MGKFVFRLDNILAIKEKIPDQEVKELARKIAKQIE